MYTLRVKRNQAVAPYVFAAIFLSLYVLVLAFLSHSYGAGLFFLIAAIMQAGYTTRSARSFIQFEPYSPNLVIQNGFTGQAYVQPADCLRLDMTKGTVSSEKLTYYSRNKTKSIVCYGDYTALLAWSKYCNNYLQGIRSGRALAAAQEFEDAVEDTARP